MFLCIFLAILIAFVGVSIHFSLIISAHCVVGFIMMMLVEEVEEAVDLPEPLIKIIIKINLLRPLDPLPFMLPMHHLLQCNLPSPI